MTPNRHRRLWTVLAVLPLLSGCGTLVERSCTLIGCSDGVFISVAGTVQASWTVRVSAPGIETFETACTAFGCGATIEDAFPETVTVTILDAEGEVVVEANGTPSYRTVRPNGPDCEPECRQAFVEVSA